MRGAAVAVLALAASLSGVCAPALAQQTRDPKKSIDQVEGYIAALNACDAAALRDIIDPSISSFGIRGAYGSARPAYMLAVETGCRMGVQLTLKPRILRHEEIGDVALSVMEVAGSSTTAGKTTPLDLRMTLVLKRGADQVWRVIHSQMATAF